MILPPVTIANTAIAPQAQVRHASADSTPEYGALRDHYRSIIGVDERMGVTVGVSLVDMQSNQPIVESNRDRQQFAASLNKVPVATLILNDVRRDRLKFDQVLSWSKDDVRAGNGRFDKAGAPMSATIQDLVYDALNPSGNTAVRVLVNQGLGGAGVTNDRIKSELHLMNTALQPLEGNRFYMGNTSAHDSMQAMRDILAPDDRYREFVKSAMASNIYTGYGVRSQMAGNPFIILSNKVGILDDPAGNNRHDAGVIYNTETKKSYAYSFIHTAPGAAGSPATQQADASVRDMGKAILGYAGDKPAEAQGRAMSDGANDTQANRSGVGIQPERRVKY